MIIAADTSTHWVQNVQASNGNDDPAGIRWINSDLIGFTYKMKNTKAKTDATMDDFLKVYYILAGQTSLLQVQRKILHFIVKFVQFLK